MPDPSTSLRAGQDLAGFSRVCPSCGRRVPRNVATCRCGVALPAEDVSAVQVQNAAGPRGGPPAFVAIALIAVLAGAGYWMFLRQPGVTMEAENELSDP